MDSLNSLEMHDGTCPIHGAFVRPVIRLRGRPVEVICPTCMAERRRLDEDEQRMARLVKQAKEWQARLVAASRLGARFRTATFENFVAKTADQRAVLEQCRAYAHNFGDISRRTPWLLGNYGTGKTHLAAAIINHLIVNKEALCILLTAREIVGLLRQKWGTSGANQHERATLAELVGADLLVIDEVANMSDADRVQLFDVVDGRYSEGLPTMLISNMSSAKVEQALGERVYDRLREGAEVLICGWDSVRGDHELQAQRAHEA